MGFLDVAGVAINSFSSSSTVFSSASYTHLPSLANDIDDPGGIQHSTSLQDTGHHVDENVALATPDRDIDQKPPPAHRSWRNPSLYSSKAIKSSTRALHGVWPKFGYKLAVVLLLSFIVFLAYFCLSHWSSEKLHYAVVLDCGSTGTRVQVYSWFYRGTWRSDHLPIVTSQSLPQVLPRKAGWRTQNRAYHRMETEPGLDKLLRNESGVKAAIDPLLHWAQKQIASAYHSSTPIFLLATAGMRRLDAADADWLLDKAWNILDKSPFFCRRSWVKIISGIEEAYYGWIALNYNLGRLGSISQQSTFGALDLGGSSLQVTFETDDIVRKEYVLNLTLGSREHHLYAFSHAGFGLNDAFDKSVGIIWRNSAENNDTTSAYIKIRHPCLNKGYQALYKCSHCLDQSVPARVSMQRNQQGVMLVGDPDWNACKVLARAVVTNFSKFSSLSPVFDCFDPPCALGRYQPDPHGQFYALSGFYVVYKFFGLLLDARFDKLLHRGKKFCLKPWKEAFDSVVPQPLVEHYCFRAPYLVSLFQEGLHLNEEQIVIGSGDMTWTLGAALVETGAFVGRKPPSNPPSYVEIKNLSKGLNFQSLDTGLLSFFLLVGMVVLLFGVTYSHHLKFLLWKKPQLPLFSQSLLATVRLPSTFFFPVRRISNRGDSVRNGEGKSKEPHSPVPQLQLRFDSLISGAGKPLVGLSGPQLTASMAHDTMKMPLKGSRLSSRRTQSRDDLIKFLHE